MAAGEAERESLRARHGVRALSDSEEGFGVDRLPNGVYGFTYAPALPSAPLFVKKTYHSFEMHKLPDGALVVVGFLPQEMADRVEAGREAIRINLYPDPQDDAVRAVSVPLSRMARVREHSAREGKGLDLELAPVRGTVALSVRYEESSAR